MVIFAISQKAVVAHLPFGRASLFLTGDPLPRSRLWLQLLAKCPCSRALASPQGTCPRSCLSFPWLCASRVQYLQLCVATLSMALITAKIQLDEVNELLACVA